MNGTQNENGIWAERGGTGEKLVILLHGIGATAAVWTGMTSFLEARGYRWIAPDFRGHGRSVSTGPFGFGNHAADISQLLTAEDLSEATILGHSFGGAVGAALSTGLFGPTPARLVTLGVKLDWSEDEIAGAHAIAQRPGKVFETESEAMERYLKVSGLAGLVAAGAPETEGGVKAVDGGFALSMNGAVFSAVGPSAYALFDMVSVPKIMAAGAEDPMVNLRSIQRIDPDGVQLDGLPHNAHVADPQKVAELMD